MAAPRLANQDEKLLDGDLALTVSTRSHNGIVAAPSRRGSRPR
jgi:hypothetical protein